MAGNFLRRIWPIFSGGDDLLALSLFCLLFLSCFQLSSSNITTSPVVDVSASLDTNSGSVTSSVWQLASILGFAETTESEEAAFPESTVNIPAATSSVVDIKSISTDVPYNVCGPGSFQSLSVDSSQWPLSRGVDFNLTLTTTAPTTVTGGRYELHIFFDTIPFHQADGNIQDFLTLPVLTGPLVWTRSVHIPKVVPEGHADFKVRSWDQNGSPLFCIELSCWIQ